MSFSCGYNLDVSIKTYKQAIAYNQLTRASISNFCKTFNLNCLDYLQNLIISKSRNVKSNLIPLEEQEKVLSIFQPIAEKMVKWSFSNETARELLVKDFVNGMKDCELANYFV